MKYDEVLFSSTAFQLLWCRCKAPSKCNPRATPRGTGIGFAPKAPLSAYCNA